MWLQRFRAIFPITFGIGVGIWLLSSSWTDTRTNQRLEKSSAVIDGRVISSSSRRSKHDGESFTLVVEFVPKNHAAIRREFDVNSSDYKSAKETGKARVTYLPEDPQVSRVTKFGVFPFPILIGLAGIMFLSALYGIRALYHALSEPSAKPKA